MSYVRTIICYLLFLSAFCSPLALGYQEQKQEVEQVERQPRKNSDQQEPAEIKVFDEESWMQALHETVSNSVFQSAVWFDSFFTDEENPRVQPRASARIRLGWRPKARDWNDFDTRFRVKVRLPYFQNKVDVILSDDDDLNQENLPLESISKETQDNSFSAAIRYVHRQEEGVYTGTRIGLSGGDLFVRGRHKRRYSWLENHGFTFEPSIYYFLGDGLGAKLLLEYDYQLSDSTQFRINYSVRGSESFSGLRWKHGFYHLNQIDTKTAAIWTFQVQGERNGDRGFVTDEYLLSYRYRFNAVKEWLFFEVEPFLEFPEEENYSTTPGIALRVEGFFYKGNR